MCPTAGAGGVGVAAVADAVAGGLGGLGGVGLGVVGLLQPGALRARARAPGAAAAQQVLRLPVRRARPVGAGWLPVPAEG